MRYSISIQLHFSPLTVFVPTERIVQASVYSPFTPSGPESSSSRKHFTQEPSFGSDWTGPPAAAFWVTTVRTNAIVSPRALIGIARTLLWDVNVGRHDDESVYPRSSSGRGLFKNLGEFETTCLFASKGMIYGPELLAASNK